jgi:hypothetical protein
LHFRRTSSGIEVSYNLHKSTLWISWNTVVHSSSSATNLGSLAPNH